MKKKSFENLRIESLFKITQLISDRAKIEPFKRLLFALTTGPAMGMLYTSEHFLAISSRRLRKGYESPWSQYT